MLLFITMLIAAIVGGIFLGYFLGCYLFDRWVNDGLDEVDNEKS